MNINWGILGTGKIAQKFADDFKYVKHGKILAVASRDNEKAINFSKQFGIEKAYDNYEKLVNDKDIDAIYISSPHHAHCENAILCLNNKKAVLCEKPIAVNEKQLSFMIDAAKKNDAFLMEAMWTYFLPSILKVKEWLNKGLIGDVEFIMADFGFQAEYDPKSRLFNPEFAGGALLDVGIYPIALSLLVMEQMPDQIISNAKIGNTSIDESNAIILKFNKGQIAQLSSSLVVELKNEASIFGTKGNIHIPNFWSSKKAFLNIKNKSPEVFENNYPAIGLNFETQEVIDLLLQNKKESPRMPLNRSLQLMRIMDEIRNQIKLKYPFE